MKKRRSVSAWAVALAYGWRQKRGKPPVSGKRCRQLSELYPEHSPEEVARRQDEKRIRNLGIGLLAILLLAPAVMLVPGDECLSGNQVRRPEPGESSQWISLSVEVGAQEIPALLEVRARARTAAEQEAVLDRAEAAMQEQLLGENVSRERVSLPLNLTASCPVEGVDACWIPREPLLVHWDGALTTEVVFGEGRETILELHLSYEGRKRVTEVPLILVDREPETQTLAEQVQTALAKAEGQLPDQEYLELPGAIAGAAVRYQQKNDFSGGGLLLLGAAALLVLYFLPAQRNREALERREQELTLSYAELTAKLKVLVGAGLTVRGAWERLVLDYEQARAAGGERRILYEEMRRTKHALSQGTLEEQAYREFGRRCGQAAYLRLGNLLESHVKNGTKGLNDMLRAESEDAFRERMQLARRQGEQISARLLLPLMLLFGLVLFLLVLPAFLAL